MMVTMGLMFVIFYFVLIRPQQKKAKEQQAMLKTVKSGDKIVTTSGIIATIVTVKDDSVSVRSADSKFEITKGAIAEIRERSGEASAS
jgi:preprotein translocase subunit YajC